MSITNEPTVQAQQAGMWEVRLADPVALVIPTPEFLVVGQSYTFTWPGSDTAQTYQVLSLAGNGWVRAEPAAGGAGMWLNTSLATSIGPIGPALTSVGDPATTLRQTEYVAPSLPTAVAPQIHRIVAEHPHARFPLPP